MIAIHGDGGWSNFCICANEARRTQHGRSRPALGNATPRCWQSIAATAIVQLPRRGNPCPSSGTAKSCNSRSGRTRHLPMFRHSATSRSCCRLPGSDVGSVAIVHLESCLVEQPSQRRQCAARLGRARIVGLSVGRGGKIGDARKSGVELAYESCFPPIHQLLAQEPVAG